jgi:hypothetical protein
MNGSQDPHDCLAVELEDWTITVLGDRKIRLRAHAYSEEEGEYVFSLLMKGGPAYFVDILRVPSAIVTDVTGG